MLEYIYSDIINIALKYLKHQTFLMMTEQSVCLKD